MEKKNYCAQTIKSICMNLSLIYAINGVVSNSYSIVQAIFIQVVYIKYEYSLFWHLYISAYKSSGKTFKYKTQTRIVIYQIIITIVVSK